MLIMLGGGKRGGKGGGKGEEGGKGEGGRGKGVFVSNTQNWQGVPEKIWSLIQ